MEDFEFESLNSKVQAFIHHIILPEIKDTNK